MGFRYGCARAVGAASAWALKKVVRRNGDNFPGKIGLYIDPNLIADLRSRVSEGSIAVVGTNGKTTVTNLLADALEQSGKTVICNRSGANLDSGVASALMYAAPAQWGVFECDELWLAKVTPGLRPTYVVLLNLFRDQLDRVGEIDHTQQSIEQALSASPQTVLVYNADDPNCQAIADKVPNRSIAFGIDEDLHLPQNKVSDTHMCQRCENMLTYDYLQYGQLGRYHCDRCGFARGELDWRATGVSVGEGGLAFQLSDGKATLPVKADFTGVYMVYNLMAVALGAHLAGVSQEATQRAIAAFDPRNGRLQEYVIGGRRVLLNLAKNPTGFNQNLNLVMQGTGSKAVALYVNDKEADGHDVSWLWDIDFEELAAIDGLVAYAGGRRRNDVQVRLKYAGVHTELVDGADDVLRRVAKESPDARVYFISNYTALPVVKGQLDKLEAETGAAGGASVSADGQVGSAGTPDALADASAGKQAGVAQMVPASADVQAEPADTLAGGAASTGANVAAGTDSAAAPDEPVAEPAAAPAASAAPGFGKPFVIVHLFPELMNLYGDNGNVCVLESRLRWRGLPVEVRVVNEADNAALDDADLVFLGGGPDREQHLASEDLMKMRDALAAYVEDDGVLLAICGGYQIAGRTWLLGDEAVPGLALADFETKRKEGGSHNRLVGNIVLDSPLATLPVVGFENHAGRTYLGAGVKPFGRVIGQNGHGNNDEDAADGIIYRNLVGTYLHGPLLAKNPQVADELIRRALVRRCRATGEEPAELAPLDDAVEIAANRALCERFGVSSRASQEPVAKDQR
jgi:CobQ-like glutamine amidotransferase family enzyme/UDP-N-acetylmuramyl tripeptide synthase